MKEFKRFLDQIDRLEVERLRTSERHDKASARIDEFIMQRAGLDAQKVQVYDPPPENIIDKLLSGKIHQTDKKTVAERLAHNAAIAAQIEQLDRNIEVLVGERDKCAAECAEDGRIAQEETETYGRFLVAMRDHLICGYKEKINELVHQHLVPLTALTGEMRRSGIPHQANMISHVIGNIQVGWWEGNKQVAAWPYYGNMTCDGRSVDLKQVMAELVEKIRRS